MKTLNLINPLRNSLNHLAVAVAAALCLGTGPSAWAATINVNYAGGPNPGNAYMNGIVSNDIAARGTATRVAPSSYTGSTWNDFPNSNSSGTALKDSTGATTPVGLTTSCNAGPWNDWTGLGARLNVSGVLANYTTPTPIFTLTGLDITHKYDLYIASLLHGEIHPADFNVGSVVKSVANSPSGATDWIAGRNYVHFAGLVPDSSGTMVVNASCAGAWNGIVLNGFQLADMGPAPSNAADMLTFNFGTYGPATINQTTKTIAVTVPYGTNVTALTPTFTMSPGATCDKAAGSTQNFTTSKTYTVTSQDLSTVVPYSVTVAVTPASSAKNILTMDPGGTITGNTIVLHAPYGTDLATLAPTYTLSPYATGTPVSGTSRNFSTPQTYTITAQNGTTQTYTVSAILLSDLPTTINVNYAGGSNPGNAWMNGYYSGDASARGSATRVAPAEYGGNFWNDFPGSGAISTNLKDSKGAATGVGLTTSVPNGPWNDWSGLGGNRMLVSGLIASNPASYSNMIALSGLNPAHTYNLYIACLHNTVSPTSTFRVGAVEKAQTFTAVTDWTEGKTHVKFTGLTPSAGGTLTVEGKSTGELVLNGFQLVDTTPQSDITRFTFPTYGAATISGTNISITVPYGTSVNALAPTYDLSYGATCVPASGSSQNFTSPVHYLVTASDNSTKDYTVTVNFRAIADPEFTLTAPANWDGRQTITVQATITNWDLLVATGGTNVNYKWSVAGVATTKTSNAGTLTLTRAQGNGPMTVTLVMDNGGLPVTHAVTINVQQPANEPWVQRTPGATEKPVDGQFFARDDTGFGKIHYNGTQSGSPDTVFLKVYRTETGSDVPYGAPLHQALGAGGSYAFTAPISGGLFKYKIVFGTTTGGNDTPVATVSNLVCGDAYIVQGQSNAEAVTPNNGTPPEANYYSSEWIRSYGNSYNGAITGGWGTALRTRTWGTANYGQHQIGGWGMGLAKQLLERHHMPICIINGAVGGTRIDQHLRNESNHQDPATIYGRLLTRIESARLTHGIRGVLWHQGEQDQGSEGPYGGDFDYKWYQENFVNLSAAWKQDFPNILNYYIYQIWPAACGSMSNGSEDMLREKQRTLPALFSNLRIMSTLGVEPGSGCHYEVNGYQMIAELMRPQVEQDHYGRIPDATETFTAPNVKRVWFTTAARNEIALEFDQDMYWPATHDPKDYFFLDGVAGKIATGSVSGKVIKLQLTAASTAKTITYLKGTGWDGNQAKLLRSAKALEITGIDINGNNATQRTVILAALTFADVPLTPPAPSGLGATAGVNQVSLTWTTAATATGYNVKRSNTVGGPYAAIGTTTGATSYTDSTATNGTTYYYLVSANNTAGESSDSNQASATPNTPYGAWVTDPAQGLTAGVNGGPMDDPDRDGIPNLLEFVLGGAPMAPSQTILPKLTNTGGTWFYEYDRSDLSQPPATIQEVEYGNNLTGWTAITIPLTGSGPVAITPGCPSDHVKVAIPALGANGFVRLKVTQ